MSKFSLVVSLFVVFVLLVGCVNADCDLILEKSYVFSGNVSRSYTVEYMYTGNVYQDNIDSIYVKDINLLSFPNMVLSSESLTSDVTQYHQDFWGRDMHSYYVNSDITVDAVSRGSVIHGYSVGGDKIYYNVFFSSDVDMSGLSGDKKINFTTPISDLELKLVGATLPGTYGSLGSTDMVFGNTGNNRVLLFRGGMTSPVHKYYNTRYIDFRNDLRVYACPVFYRFDILRENLSGWDGDTVSKWHIYSGDFDYINSSGYNAIDESAYAFPPLDVFCDEVDITIGSPAGYYREDKLLDICDIEIGYFDLSGYTRSVYGALIPDVKLTAQDNTKYSNNIGFYKFENLKTGSITLEGSKTGYWNVSDSLYISSPGSYWHDVYMIPLDALDTGEFGGVVYDYCTLAPVENAYVYLLNKSSAEESYVIASGTGFYKFPGLAVDSNYSVRASKIGYEQSVIYDFTFNETTDKIHNIWLLPEGGCPEKPIPTAPPPTPTPPMPTPSPIPDIIFDLLGIENGAYLLALLSIGLMAGIFGKFSHFNPIVTALGGFFGFIFSILMEWIPSWLLGVVIVMVVAAIAAMIIKSRG